MKLGNLQELQRGFKASSNDNDSHYKLGDNGKTRPFSAERDRKSRDYAAYTAEPKLTSVVMKADCSTWR